METTPFCVEQRFVPPPKNGEYVVVNGWTGNEYGSFATREEAELEAERLAKANR